ncbi:MAG: MFS transporter [Sulfolobales archaeon]|nr:MFS transporter [Sulfolobales archaeon]MDW8082913.1 MFS transporter [Sulfolobales archaeon]
MWLIASAAYLALLSFTDLWFFLYLALVLKADPVTLGIASSGWSLLFIASNLVFGKLVERGYNKSAAFISSVLLCLSTYVITNSEDIVVVVAAYSLLHAISTSLGRVAANVTLLEYVEYESWSKYNYLFNYITLIARGLLLIAGYLNYLTTTSFLLLTIAISTIFSIALPQILIPLERTLFKLSKRLDKVYGYVKFTSILPELLEDRLNASRALEIRWETGKELPTYRPLLGAFTIVTFSDALFILVPTLISSYIGSKGTLLVYGLSSIASAAALAVISRISTRGTRTTLASGIARSIIIPSILSISSVEYAIAYILSTAVLFNIFNTSNYDSYINSTAGQRAFLYGVAVELGSAVGSLIGGVVASYCGIEYVVAASAIGHVLASIIASYP